ncbi:hypothetical protein RQ832_10070 [Roseomonas sp. DSM 102946]|nr:hypothetical protein [Roseomonas sp. DSM 102946]
MLHTLSIWPLVGAFFGVGLFNAIGTPATQSKFVRWGYPKRWWFTCAAHVEAMFSTGHDVANCEAFLSEFAEESSL